MSVRRAAWGLGALLALLLAVVLVIQLRYRSWPLQTPHRLAWCGVEDWERSGVATTPLPVLHPVGRKPPVIGTVFYSPYSPARRTQLNRSDMGGPCGGVLLARDGGELVEFTPPG